MRNKHLFLLIVMIFTISILGCSNTNPVTSSGTSDEELTLPMIITDYLADGSISAGMGTLGLFQLSLDKSSAELTSLRKNSLTDVLEVVDITNFLQLAPCTDCAKIKSVSIDTDVNVVVSIGIKHPFDVGDILKPITGRNRADLHVFNVEGIVVSDATASNFPLIGELTAGFSLINADGYTGYLDDSFDSIFPTDATIHPYVLHFDDYSQGNFNLTNPMGFESVINPPPSGNLVMAMGCDYNYQDYVFNIPSDQMDFIFAIRCTYAVSAATKSQRFDPEYRIPQHIKKAASEVSVVLISNDLKSGDTSSSAQIEIHAVDMNHGIAVGEALNEMHADSSVSQILIDVPGVINTPITIDGNNPVSGTGHDPSDPLVYSGTIVNVAGASRGIYPGLVKVADSYPPGLNELPLLNGMDGIERVDPTLSPLTGLFTMPEFATYQIFKIGIEPGWSNNWGGELEDYGRGVAMDGSGNAYVTGEFRQSVDFDPGAGETWGTSNGSSDIFLSKFNSSGSFLWAITWGGNLEDTGYGVTVDGSDNAYVTGYFKGTVDFDPGTGEVWHTSNGAEDIFLSKFNPSGNLLWAITWGGNSEDIGYNATIDSLDNAYITGYFKGIVDFNPGAGLNNHTSNGAEDIFLSKFNSSGSFLWTITWGGVSEDIGYGVIMDPSGDVLVTGSFSDTVDFDPGAGLNNHTSNGLEDIFLSKIHSSGIFDWANTWGGSLSDVGYGSAAHGSGNIYVTGFFSDTVDFDPGAGVDNHTSNGETDVFISKFSSSGGLSWINVWGGSSYDQGRSITVHGAGNAYVTGHFSETVDFDPKSGIDNHISNGVKEVFLSKIHSSGSFLWAKTWGGLFEDEGLSVAAADVTGNVYVTGYFSGIVDFDPGPDESWGTSNGETDIFLSRFLPDGSW